MGETGLTRLSHRMGNSDSEATDSQIAGSLKDFLLSISDEEAQCKFIVK